MTHALIKITDDGTTIIPQPYPQYVDELAYAIFDCYGYHLCMDYTSTEDDQHIPSFDLYEREIDNPYKQSEDDPDKVIIRMAAQRDA